MSKFMKIFLMVLFPLGILYCVGKNLWAREIEEFLGGIFLFGGGFVLSLWLFNPEIVIKILPFLA